MNTKKIQDKTIKVIGYSTGDRSVGIGEIPFEIDTGVEELNDSDRKFIAETMIRAIYELHDNGDVRFYFSDENTGDFDYSNVFGYKEMRTLTSVAEHSEANTLHKGELK